VKETYNLISLNFLAELGLDGFAIKKKWIAYKYGIYSKDRKHV